MWLYGAIEMLSLLKCNGQHNRLQKGPGCMGYASIRIADG